MFHCSEAAHQGWDVTRFQREKNEDAAVPWNGHPKLRGLEERSPGRGAAHHQLIQAVPWLL